MTDILSLVWIIIGWIFTLIVHLNSLHRGAISDQKEKLIELISHLSTLSWLNEDNKYLTSEDQYTNILERIRLRITQLNKLSHTSLVNDKILNHIYDFDTEVYVDSSTDVDEKRVLKYKFMESCNNLIIDIEKNYFEKILNSKLFIFRTELKSWISLIVLICIVLTIAA